MPSKLPRRVACAFCVESTEHVWVGEYVEFEVTVPESEALQRQLFGAHTGRLSKTMREGREVEVDLLVDVLRIGDAPGRSS